MENREPVVFVVVYLSGRYDLVVKHLSKNGTIILPERIVQMEQNWPIDFGDDPSFLTSELFKNKGGMLSWGICRPSLRKKLIKNDIVVFVAFDNSSYRLTAIANVRELLSQCEIAIGNHYPYTEYPNLLVAFDPDNHKLLHQELDNRNHPNWLWRILQKGSSLREKDLEEISKTDEISLNQEINGHKVEIGKNYVIFDNAFIIKNPVDIAAYNGGKHEIWNLNSIAKLVKSFTVDHPCASRNFIRSKRKRNPHPYLVINCDVSEWQNLVLNELKKAGVEQLP